MRRYNLKIRDREFVVDVDEMSANEFVVNVGEQSFDVALTDEQDLSLAAITPQMAAPAVAPVVVPVAAPPRAAAAPRAKAQAAGGANVMKAPMPGVILEVSVTAGTRVERGQAVAVLEAMKMQNTIRSPRAGTIAEVFAVAGESVAHGDPIVRFESA